MTTLPYSQSCPPLRLELYQYKIKSLVEKFCVKFSINWWATVNVKIPVKIICRFLKFVIDICCVINVSPEVYM